MIVENVTNENAVVKPKAKTGRNGLIELYRFLFALWVVYYHGFFVVKTANFNHGYIAVEFFFILSGYYLIKAIDKFKSQPFFAGLGKFCLKRLKAIALPFSVGVVFAIWFMILDKEYSFLGYLWYIPFMFLSFAIVYFCRKFIKNEKWFVAVIALFVVVSYVILYVPILEYYGFFRGLGGVSLGVLLSYIPKVELKCKKFNFNWLITIVLFVVVLFLAYQRKENFVSEYFMVLLLIPALLYFSSTLNVNSKVLNFLGSMSFGLYAYQCIIRVIDWYFSLKSYWLFLILVALTVTGKGCEWLIARHIKYKQVKKLQAQSI